MPDHVPASPSPSSGRSYSAKPELGGRRAAFRGRSDLLGGASGGTFEPILTSLTLPPRAATAIVTWTVQTGTREVEMQVEERTTEAFVERAIADLAACYGGVMVSIGHKLGLSRALAGQGPLSSFELAARTNCEERYVREWLNWQVVAGYLAYRDESET